MNDTQLSRAAVGKHVRNRLLRILVAVATGALGCDDGGTTAPSDEPDLVAGLWISEPVFAGASLGLAGSEGAGTGVLYLSATPSTFPGGELVRVTNQANGESVTGDIIGGGFDPLRITGSPDDQLEIVVPHSDGTTTVALYRVPTRRRPRVVRTRPTKDATHVVLNSTVTIIFSEPIGVTTVTTETIRLLRDGQLVPGTLSVSGEGWRVEFEPREPFEPETTYSLVITTGIRDLAGDALEDLVELSFQTGILSDPVTLSPNPLSLLKRARQQLTVLAQDDAGTLLGDPPAVFASSDPAIATVSATGRVTAVAEGTATITVSVEDKQATTEVTVRVLTFSSVTAGADHTCALTTEGEAYCWGSNQFGQLGIGTQSGPQCWWGALFEGEDPWISCRMQPTLVSEQLRFHSLSAGGVHTCGITSDGVYCWGSRNDGEYLYETSSHALTPARVGAGQQFASVNAGDFSSCALTAAGEAYCWGSNQRGELGDGTFTSRLEPVLVTGGHRFQSITAGATSCGIVAEGAVYCWGAAGKEPESVYPKRVEGELSFRMIDSNARGSCGVTVDGETYCWGSNTGGQLGDGTTEDRTTPTPVVGGLSFRSVSIGLLHTCGVTEGGHIYCWGRDIWGQLGTGRSGFKSAIPLRVSGTGLSFSAVAPGYGHTCGLTTEGAIYCWGLAHPGQLGNRHSRTVWDDVVLAPVPTIGSR